MTMTEMGAIVVLDGTAGRWCEDVLDDIDHAVTETEDHYVNWYTDPDGVTEGTIVCTEEEFDEVLRICWQNKHMFKEVRMEGPYVDLRAATMEE